MNNWRRWGLRLDYAISYINCILVYDLVRGVKDYVSLYLVYSPRTRADINGGQNFHCN